MDAANLNVGIAAATRWPRSPAAWGIECDASMNPCPNYVNDKLEATWSRSSSLDL